MLWLTSSICVLCSTMWSIYFFTYASCCIMSFISQIEFWSLTYIYKKVHKVYVGFLNGWCRGFLCIFPLGDRLECVSDRVKDRVLASSYKERFLDQFVRRCKMKLNQSRYLIYRLWLNWIYMCIKCTLFNYIYLLMSIYYLNVISFNLFIIILITLFFYYDISILNWIYDFRNFLKSILLLTNINKYII